MLFCEGSSGSGEVLKSFKPMKFRNSLIRGYFRRSLFIVNGFTAAAILSAHSQIEYSTDFESLDVEEPSALVGASWQAFTNTFTSAGAYIRTYQSFPDIGGSGFWAITTDQAGPGQGVQSLSVYGDYYNQTDQLAGNLLEVNVFQQFPIFIEDVGSYEFRFDAKTGNLAIPSTAQAFIKVLNPSAGYATVAIASFDTSALPVTWGSYSIRLDLDESMEDMLLQFGFSTPSSLNLASGVFYDNLSFGIAPPGPAAPFAVTEITRAGTVVTLTFPTEIGFSYDLVKSTAGMTSFVPVPAQLPIPGDGAPKVAIDSAATEPAAFYRIRRQP